MTKAYRAKMLTAIEQMEVADLRLNLHTLESWIATHEKKKSSYFWHSPSTASSRRYEERRNTFESHVVIGEDTIWYWSDCRISCNHIYWKDGLYIKDSAVKINFADIAEFKECAENALLATGQKVV